MNTENTSLAEKADMDRHLELAEIDYSEQDPIVDWKLKPAISDLEQDLSNAQVNHKKQLDKIDHWLKLLNVEREPKKPSNIGRSRVNPKLIRKQVEWRYASLSEPFLTTQDLFDINPVTYEDKKSAEQNAIVLNNQFNTKLQKRSFVDEYVRTAADEGTVIVRVGWESEEGIVTKEFPVYSYEVDESEEALSLINELMVRAESDPVEFKNSTPEELQIALRISTTNGKVTIPVETGKRYEDVRGLVKNQPSLEICNYKNVIIDPTCKGDINKAGFLAYQFETSYSELKKAGIYKNLDFINTETIDTHYAVVQDSDREFVANDEGDFQFKDYPRRKFVATEYWGYRDIDGSGIVKPFVCTYVGQIILRMEENPFPDKKIPFVVVPYSTVRKSVYGEPDGVLLEDNQEIVGAVTRGMIDVMGRSANGQTGIRKDALDVTNRRKYNRGEDYEFNPTVGDPRSAMYTHTHEEFPQSAVTMLNLQLAEAESLTGVKAFNNGISGNALGESVGGINSVLDATAKREAAILGRLADGIVNVGRKIVSMNSVFLSEEEVVRITNEDFVTIRRDDLQGNFDLSIDISTSETDNSHIEKLSFLMQTLGNNIPFEITQKFMVEIAKLQKLPAFAKEIQEYQPQPDPLEEKRKELELAELEAKISLLYSQATENEAEAAENRAKVRKLNAETDNTLLNFVEQETGTAHVRDMDKIQGQARAQGETKFLEHILDKDKEKTNSSK